MYNASTVASQSREREQIPTAKYSGFKVMVLFAETV
jgi:hypothetical protein